MHNENENTWFTKDRSETASNRVPERALDNNVSVKNLGLGLHVYQNTFSNEDAARYIDTLESNLSTGAGINGQRLKLQTLRFQLRKQETV